jgi:hypothetical protein
MRKKINGVPDQQYRSVSGWTVLWYSDPFITKGLRPLDPRPAGGRCRGRPRVDESASSLIHAKYQPTKDKRPVDSTSQTAPEASRRRSE